MFKAERLMEAESRKLGKAGGIRWETRTQSQSDRLAQTLLPFSKKLAFDFIGRHFFTKSKLNNQTIPDMNIPIANADLTKQAPLSPHDRFGGFAIIGRTTDKCRASIAGKLGEFHYDCPLDNMLFSFKGINGDQFKNTVKSAKSYEDVATWLQSAGTPKTAAEIEAWSDKVEALKAKDIPTMQDPKKREDLKKSCQKLGLDFENTTLFDWLDADDEASFDSELAAK